MTNLPTTRRSFLGPLWLQVLIGIALGIAFGALAPHHAVALKPLGDGFIKLIRMTLAPIVFASVVTGIARMGDIKEVGRIGAKTLIYFELISTFALVVGLVAANLLQPGKGMNIDPAALDAHAISGYTATALHLGVSEFLLNIIPSSVGDAFTSGNMLQVILFSILFGLALAQFRETARPLVELLDLVLKGMFGVVRFVMMLAPIGAFGAMAYTIGQYGVASLLQLAQFTAELWIISLLFVVVVFGAIAYVARFSLWKLLRYMREELLITLGTSSSEAVLAPMMIKMEKLGCDESVVGMVMPAGYTFNADGTSIYLSMGAIFIAQAMNIHLGLRDQLVILLVLMVTSKGAGGVAGAGFIALAATLSSMHQIPVAGLVLLLGVERFVNAARAMVNIIGNSVAAIVIARWEGAYNAEQAALVFDGRSSPEDLL